MSSVSQAVILAGGLGTRLMPLTENIPKPLVEVAGKPYLEWQLRYLSEQNIHRVLLLVSHFGEKIESYFSRNPMPDMQIDFAFEEKPMGTGGALLNAHALLDEKFWLINGDSFLPLNFAAMEHHFLNSLWRATIATLRDTSLVPVPANLLISTDGHITEFRKGAGAGFDGVDAGVYLLNKSVVRDPGVEVFNLEEYWPKLIAEHKLGSFPVKDRFFDIGTPERLKTFAEHIHDYF